MQWTEFRSHLRHLPHSDVERVKRAFELGQISHAGQKRRSGEPYFSHPVAVADLLADTEADADTLIAALLHDTIEDTELRLPTIEKQFGPSVTSLIDGVTKLSSQELPPEKPSLNEQIETLRKMFRLMQNDVRIMVIKLYDRLHNMQTVQFLPSEKQKALAQETLDVYVKIADRLCMQDVRDEMEGLCLSVLEPEIYLQLTELNTRNEKRLQPVIDVVHENVSQGHSDIGKNITIKFEPATWQRRRTQFESAGATVTGQTPLSIAIVCPTVDACYAALGILHQHWQREIQSFQDYINSPAINGYRGLHTTVIFSDGTRVRCKIRTEEMHEYARKGIASRCFRKQSGDLLAILPWMQRLTPLTEDTTDRSSPFWESLQSDILGESIAIHGPDDHTVLLPKRSTALDGVFHLFGETALRTREILLDGKQVPFDAELEHACSISAVFADTPQMELSWVDAAHTGFATALIRQGLASESHDRKIETGRQLLQSHLNSRHRGFLSEFDQIALTTLLKNHGYHSTEDVYVRIAEGKIEAAEIEDILFRKKPAERQRSAQRMYTLQCTVVAAQRRFLLEMLQYYHVRSIRIRPANGSLRYTCTLMLSGEEYRSLSYTLARAIGVTTWSLAPARALHLVSTSIVLLFVIWGLDPVMARFLLKTLSVAPVDLVIVRFWTLTVMSAMLLFITRLRAPLREQRLILRSWSLWCSVALLSCVAVSTYFALQGTPASHYTIPMTAAGVVLTSITKRRHIRMLACTWGLVIAGVLLLMATTPSWSWRSIVFTVIAVVSFTGFSIVSERYKREAHVDVRAAQYFFLLSLLCAAATLPLLPFSTLPAIVPSVLVRMILFSIIFPGIPYYMYYYLLSHKQIDFVLRFSFLIIIPTVLGEMILFGIPSIFTLLAGLIVAIGAALPLLPTPFLPRSGDTAEK